MSEQTTAVQAANPFAASRAQQMTTTEMATTRQQSEVQSMLVIAKKFPRDPFASFNQIMEACKRPSLAAEACYSFPRGGSRVTGPSIRLAEVLAQAWGNVDFGITELERRRGESTMMVYAWDMETNCRRHQIFTVKHQRDTRGGGVELDNERDIYEMTANQGARRLRACILGVIPADVVEKAVDQCERTLAEGGGAPLQDRIKSMAAEFSAFGVTPEMLEARLGHKLNATTEQEIATLKKIFLSLRDGMSGVDQWFDASSGQTTTTTTAGLANMQAVDFKQAQEPTQGAQGGQSQFDPAAEQEARQGEQEPPAPAKAKKRTKAEMALDHEVERFKAQKENREPRKYPPVAIASERDEASRRLAAAQEPGQETQDAQEPTQDAEQEPEATSPQEPELTPQEPAQEPEPPAPTHDPGQSDQAKLEAWMIEKGFTWRHFQMWAEETGTIQGTTSMETIHQLPDVEAGRMLGALDGLEMGLEMAKAMD